MQITLPHKAKQALLDVLRQYIPTDLKKFTGEIVISLKEENVGIIKYLGHVKVNYVDNV